MDYGDLAQDVRSAFSRRTDIYRNANRPARGRLGGSTGFEKEVKESIRKVLPKEQEIGNAILTNSKQIIDNLTKLEEEWQEKISDFEFGIDDAWERVIQGAKEDVAMFKHEEAVEELVDQGVDEDDAEDQAEDFDPSDIEDEEIWDHYTEEDIWQWWNQEWSHNVAGKSDKKGNKVWPLAKYVDEGDFDFHQFQQYEFHMPGVFMGIIRDFEQDAQRVIYDVKEKIIEIENDLMEKRKELFDAIFEKKDFYLKD